MLFIGVEELVLKLKEEFLRLLREDVEFRYAVVGLIGLEEVLRRLDRHEEELEKIWREIRELRENMISGFRRHDEELRKIREDMLSGFKRYDEELRKLREDMVSGFRRYDEELKRLREDMKEGFELVNRHVSALGARWGLLAEEAFREGLKGVLERELGLKVERWAYRDGEGYVYGYPSVVEVDVAVKDGRVILVEVSSHVRRSDVLAFKRKVELYERITGRRVDRLLMVTPYAEGEAFEAARRLGVEIYTGV